MNASLEPKVLCIPSTSYLILFRRHILFGEIRRNPDRKATVLQTPSHNHDYEMALTKYSNSDFKSWCFHGLAGKVGRFLFFVFFIGRNLLILINHGPQ